jgi:hypothetical protein
MPPGICICMPPGTCMPPGICPGIGIPPGIMPGAPY